MVSAIRALVSGECFQPPRFTIVSLTRCHRLHARTDVSASCPAIWHLLQGGLFLLKESKILGMNQDHRSASHTLQRFDHPHPSAKEVNSAEDGLFVLNSNFVCLNHSGPKEKCLRDLSTPHLHQGTSHSSS